MTTRLIAGLLLATSLTTGATVLAAGDHWTHADAHQQLAFEPDRQVLLQSVGHMALLSSPEVMVHLRRWLA